MRLPEGELRRSRVLAGPGPALSDALESGLTGYAVLEPQDSLLLSADACGVITFEDGVPVLAYHTDTDRGGPPALADLAVPGPYRVDLVSLPAAALSALHETPELTVPPGMAAERLAGDAGLAERTRERAPADRLPSEGTDPTAGDGRVDPVETFLADEAKIEAIRERARAEARERAAEWGFDDVPD